MKTKRKAKRGKRGRGSIQPPRYPGDSWWVIFTDREKDETTGKTVPKRRWHKVVGDSDDEALKEQTRLLGLRDTHRYVPPGHRTVAAWLREWLPLKRQTEEISDQTAEEYRRIIEQDIAPIIGDVKLDRLTSLQLGALYTRWMKDVSASTINKRHAVLHGALETACTQVPPLVLTNVANYIPNKPAARSKKGYIGTAWDAAEARRFMLNLKGQDAETVAMWALALDAGCRRGELAGVRWPDINLETGVWDLQWQLRRTKGGYAQMRKAGPTFDAPKWDSRGVIMLHEGTTALLKAHKRAQAEQKMKLRDVWQDHDLVFTNPSEPGLPIDVNHLARAFNALCDEAKVRRIRVHDCRHTSAALCRAEGVPIETLSKRLRHSKTSTTMDIYTHVSDAMDRSASAAVGRVLHGT
jgi:integrase